MSLQPTIYSFTFASLVIFQVMTDNLSMTNFKAIQDGSFLKELADGRVILIRPSIFGENKWTVSDNVGEQYRNLTQKEAFELGEKLVAL